MSGSRFFNQEESLAATQLAEAKSPSTEDICVTLLMLKKQVLEDLQGMHDGEMKIHKILTDEFETNFRQRKEIRPKIAECLNNLKDINARISGKKEEIESTKLSLKKNYR